MLAKACLIFIAIISLLLNQICTGQEHTYVIFSNRHEIRRLDTSQESYVSLVSGLKNTIALNFYYNQDYEGKTKHEQTEGDGSLIFWTDVVDDRINKGTLISNCEWGLYAWLLSPVFLPYNSHDNLSMKNITPLISHYVFKCGF